MIRRRWCGWCGALLYFTQNQLDWLLFMPPCPRCGEPDWRDEWDEMLAPDLREP